MRKVLYISLRQLPPRLVRVLLVPIYGDFGDGLNNLIINIGYVDKFRYYGLSDGYHNPQSIRQCGQHNNKHISHKITILMWWIIPKWYVGFMALGLSLWWDWMGISRNCICLFICFIIPVWGLRPRSYRAQAQNLARGTPAPKCVWILSRWSLCVSSSRHLLDVA